MPQAATIKSLPRAFRMMKAMQAQGIEWSEDYRRAAGQALVDILHGRMASAIDRHLAEIAARGVSLLLVEQKLAIALKISKRILVMGHGRIVFTGTTDEFTANTDIRKEWLEV